ncbi:alpha/beta fold hydrolase [Nitrosococcus wardiae]|uniref:Alpha/beta hydrolase n=1 Tax=Nitrosococcus wardiae TaxID=1814290 RepID=A0A4P7BXD4_9GAMM|nr:alpha/beta hydrolase [Nitrosococcus wardiae]QBQ53102.1 alpha/beta hydrolase [Nitrosococcus wardiae]
MPVKSFPLMGLFLFLMGCVVSPTLSLDAKAREWGMTRKVIPGAEFRHVVYTHHFGQPRKTLHVYLDGDGSPWINRRWISRDPTPRNPLALRLMAQDSVPSVYLGRPCYHGLANDPPCTPQLWTYGRYSLRVVDSMAVALTHLLGADNFNELVLIGYSGGGALAMLLAERLPQTVAVVTIAGNLNPVAWARHHGYTSLWDSLNPSQQPPLNPVIFQLHLLGGRDQNILPSMVRPAVSRQKHAKLHLLADFDHVCCWWRIWPSVLAALHLRDHPMVSETMLSH